MAEKLMLGVGDKVEMLFVETGDRPRRDRFKVAGIYSSGISVTSKTDLSTQNIVANDAKANAKTKKIPVICFRLLYGKLNLINLSFDCSRLSFLW